MASVYRGRDGRSDPRPERCVASVVSNGRGFWTRQCARKAVVEENGYGWCNQHAPSAEKARQDASRERQAAQWRAESARQMWPARMAQAIRQYLDHHPAEEDACGCRATLAEALRKDAGIPY